MAYDITQPDLPVEICRKYIGSKKVLLHDSLIFVPSGHKGLYIYDTHAGTCPEAVSHIPQELPGHNIEAACVDDNYIYMMEINLDSILSEGLHQYLRISDYSNLEEPFTTAMIYDTTIIPFFTEMVVEDGLVYIAYARLGLVIFDVHDPYNPIKIGRYALFPGDDDLPYEYTSNLAKKNSLIFLAVNGSNCIQVLDVSDPTSPVLVDYYQMPAEIRNLEIRDNYLYSVCFSGMYIHRINSICGDVNDDGNLNIFDVTYLIGFLYGGGPQPEPIEHGDVNSDSVINIFDITYYISFLYKNGPEPNCPQSE